MDSVANVAGFGLGGVIAISDGCTPQTTAEYVCFRTDIRNRHRSDRAASLVGRSAHERRRVAHVMPYRRQVQIAANLAAR